MKITEEEERQGGGKRGGGKGKRRKNKKVRRTPMRLLPRNIAILKATVWTTSQRFSELFLKEEKTHTQTNT